MTTPAKLGLGLLSLGSATGIAYAGSTYFSNSKELESKPQKTSISSLIEKEYKYLLLDTKDGTGNADAAQWETNWESYKTANKDNVKDFFELDGWTKGTASNLKDTLRRKCATLSESKIESKEEELYKRVTAYCGRHVSIKDQSKKEGLNVIPTNNGTSAWDKFVGQEEQQKEHFTNLAITAKSSGKVTAQDIKDGCAKAIEKNKSEPKYDKAYASYKVLCAN